MASEHGTRQVRFRERQVTDANEYRIPLNCMWRMRYAEICEPVIVPARWENTR